MCKQVTFAGVRFRWKRQIRTQCVNTQCLSMARVSCFIFWNCIRVGILTQKLWLKTRLPCLGSKHTEHYYFHPLRNGSIFHCLTKLKPADRFSHNSRRQPWPKLSFAHICSTLARCFSVLHTQQHIRPVIGSAANSGNTVHCAPRNHTLQFQVHCHSCASERMSDPQATENHYKL